MKCDTVWPHSERRVCESFLEGLDDTWWVLPQVRIADPSDPEIPASGDRGDLDP